MIADAILPSTDGVGQTGVEGDVVDPVRLDAPCPNATSVPPAGSRPNDEIVVEGFRPLLPEGIWLEAKLTGHDTALIFRAPKVILHFSIVQPGEFFGKAVFRAFRVKRLLGRPGPNGRFVLGARSDLYTELIKLLDLKVRADRVSLRALRQMLFRVKTRTVRRNHEQKATPELLFYTTIEEIVRGE
jgi:hypothetical protein